MSYVELVVPEIDYSGMESEVEHIMNAAVRQNRFIKPHAVIWALANFSNDNMGRSWAYLTSSTDEEIMKVLMSYLVEYDHNQDRDE